MAPKLTQTIRRVALSPLTIPYWAVVKLRHWLYDYGILKSSKAVLPTLVLGNIHAGGTGKTPHASYFLQLLSKKLGGPQSVALLSRGYKRSSKGFKIVKKDNDWSDYGDEPALLKSLNPLNPIAVCKNRLLGVERIKEEFPDVKVVVLDDGLQHRKLIPHRSVALLDSDRPILNEAILPAGNLRDLKSRLKTFDAFIISRRTQSLEEEVQKQGLNTSTPIFASSMQEVDIKVVDKPRILAVSGIAESQRFINGLSKKWSVVRRECYSDHYTYSEKDVKDWLASIRNEKLDALVTTSKDAVRIRPLIENQPEIKLKSICIEVVWDNEDEVEVWVDEWLDSTIFARQ
tara:strand:- start:199 stop:1233 length:1035 start_codon:yes stop_codon:yes gene_type:complete